MSRRIPCKICENDFYYTVSQMKGLRYTHAQIAQTLRESHGLAVRTEDVQYHFANCHREKTTSKNEATLIKRLEQVERKVEVKKARGRPKKERKPSKKERRVDKEIEKAKVDLKEKMLKKVKSKELEIDVKDAEPVDQIRTVLRKRWERLRLFEETEVLTNEGNPLPQTRQELKDLSSDLFNFERLLMDKDVKVTEVEEKKAQIQQMTINVLAPLTDIKKMPEGQDPLQLVAALVDKLAAMEGQKTLPPPRIRSEGLAE